MGLYPLVIRQSPLNRRQETGLGEIRLSGAFLHFRGRTLRKKAAGLAEKVCCSGKVSRFGQLFQRGLTQCHQAMVPITYIPLFYRC